MKKYLIWLLFAVACFAQSGPFTPSGGSQSLFLNVAGGIAAVSTTPTLIAPTTVPLAANSTNYVYVDLSLGIITSNTSGFSSTNYPVAKAVTNGTQVITFTDVRPGAFNVTGTSSGGAGTVTSVGLVGTGGQITVTGTSPITGAGSFTLSIPNALTVPGTLTVTGTSTFNSTVTITGLSTGCLTNTSGVISSTGVACGTGGGGGNTTSTSLTTNSLPKANGANSIINSLISDDGTTATIADTGGLSLSGSSAAGFLGLLQGTAQSTGAAGTIGLTAPSSVTNPYNIVLPVLDATGVLSCTDSTHILTCSWAAASAALSALTNATGNNTLTNAANLQVWNWHLTAPSSQGFTIGETTASTGGSGGGFGNQNLFAVQTLSGSTANPFEITQGAVTGANPIPAMQISTTWNAVGTTHIGMLFNAVNTASAAGSLLAEFQLGGTSQWQVDKGGNSVQVGSITTGSGGTVAGQVSNAFGTLPAIPTGAVGHVAPASGTAYQIVDATAAATGIPHYANSSNTITTTISGIAIADLTATGTPSSTTFLRGDNTWATPSGGGGTPCTTTALSVQYNNSGAFGCVPDLTFSTPHTLALGASGIVDLSAGAPTAALKIPSAAGAVPTADGFIGENTTNHTFVYGGNGTTLVSAVAATGTGTATTCTNQFVSVVSGIAAPTCATVTSAAVDTSITKNIASGTSAMGTGAISSGTCATVVTTTATGAATTDTIVANPNVDPTGVTGYGPSATGSLYIQAYPTSGNINFKVCNNTSGSITPSALTLNWKVIR